ncbi:BT_3928 family protein [Flavivirga sp. 57AJ16]|uniref:BT_3928 family protein n=1 Tax=Flavivirga sp. 57AJ16 TaxID=3025307 RepID=UPI0023655885|nr:BT_3928 family protein [Flavivirga sp. 57AJ16]MDD7885278.1 DoxX family membrane protein [Flavivirga sp. 57AJ16]
MKIIVAISRIFVGVLFIISGLIKLNDPLGFSYKLEEYFSADVLNITFLEPYALMVSVLVVVFEVVLGVFLLIGYKPKFTIWSLLGMIMFFTFLTFYSAYFDKVKDCGCFGDALKLTPWESFIKDLVLLFFILILFFGIRHIKPVFNKLITTVLALLGFIFSLWFGYYVLEHLPVKDFRAYKIGANIQEGMSVPEDAVKPIVEYSWKFSVDGEEKIITTNGSYPSVKGDFIGVDTKVVQEGYQPPIYDFSIESEDEDLTQAFLTEENLIVVISYSLEKIEQEGAKKLKALSERAIKNGYKVIGLTASGADAKQQIKEAYGIDFEFYLCDEKALKTVVRSNPGIIELDAGTIKQKVHWNDIDNLELPKVERKQEPKVAEDIMAYFINGELSTKESIEALEKEKIESINVVKDSLALAALNTQNNTIYTGIIEVTLKPNNQQPTTNN